ncbi:Uncharacterised protein [uncultured archaeon]|nr:Uncharacterised protein [uncultured archaeon]
MKTYYVLLQKTVFGKRYKTITKSVKVIAEDILTAYELAKSTYNFPDVSMIWPIE